MFCHYDSMLSMNDVTTLSLAVFRLNGALIAAGNRLTAPLGLTSARWQVMGAISLAGAPQTVARIARAMGLARQSVQRLADQLAKDGVVAFADNPDDRRARLVSLTPRGEALFARIMGEWNALAEQLAAGRDVAAWRGAVATLEYLRTGLEKTR